MLLKDLDLFLVSKIIKVTKDTLVGDLLQSYPQSVEIMANYGFHCINCNFNAFDSIENGAKIHGLTEAQINSLVSELNSMNSEEQKHPFYVTLRALTELKASKTLEEFVEVYADDELKLNLQIVKEKKKGQIEVDYKGVKIIFDKELEKLVKGVVIDYVLEFNFEGFTISKLVN